MLGWVVRLLGQCASMGGLGDMFAWMACWREWHASVDGMLLLLLLLLLRYYPEEKNVECILLKQK